MTENDAQNQSLGNLDLDENSQIVQNADSEANVLRSFSVDQKGEDPMKAKSKVLVVLMVVAVAAGIGTGFGLHKLTAKSGGSSQVAGGGDIEQVAGDNVKAGDVFGSQNADAFKDTAEGYLEMGGVDGEGSHKLLRPGGETQTVYLTSSVTDLDKFDGMEVKIWGETFKAQKAGWLMDVGRVEVVKVKGEAPVEE